MKNKEPWKNILVIDDDAAVGTSLKLMLSRAGMSVTIVNYPVDALEYLRSTKPDLVLLDMNFSIDTSGRQGLKLLESIQAIHPKLPIIMITGWGTLQLAVEGMKKGARDFLTKPWDNKELLSSIKTILTLDEQESLKPHNREIAMSFEGIIGRNKGFLEVIDKARKVSKTDASVLILGESGTGKELLAEAIHYESLRSNEAFVKVNLGGISSTLFESEMFGHKKGAFTDAHNDRKGRFEIAHKGTIFLDEIGDLDLGCQVKLLRVLQEKTFEVLGSSETSKVNVRVVSATNKNLSQMVADKSFREDLFYRINLICLTLPPLRERRDDIPLLVNHYVKNLSEIYQLPMTEVSEKAMAWLKDQPFTGNIRQLKNLVERTLLLSSKTLLEKEDFEVNQSSDIASGQNSSIPSVGQMSLEEMEKEMILKALEYHNYKIQKAALSLGITRSALYRRMSKFNIAYES